MKDIKLLVFDIDGTLVDRTKQTVEDSAIDAMHEAQKKGYEILVATGRSFFFIHDDVLERVNPDYFVTVNGACLTNGKGEILKTYSFSKETLKTLINYCGTHDYPLGIKNSDHIAVYGDTDSFITQYGGHNPTRLKYLIPDNDHLSVESHEPMGVFYYADQNTYTEAQKLIPELYFIPDKRGCIEAVLSGVDKTKTIEDVLTTLNLTWDNVMSFGDGNNDVEMLEKAKIGVAMGNAEEKVQIHADYVTDTVLNDGILKALKHFEII